MQADDYLIEAFLEMMAAEQGAALNTLSAYKSDLEEAKISLKARKRRLGDAASGDIANYMQQLSMQQYASTTLARKLSVLKRFYRFLNIEKLRSDNPALQLEAPKTGKALPKTLEGHQISRLLQTAKDQAEQADMPFSDAQNKQRQDAPVIAWRLYALLEVLYATGMRVSELVSLPLSAARSRDAFLLVRGKGNKERLVPLTPQARAAMRQYLERLEAYQAGQKKQHAKTSSYLFPASSQSGHFTRQAFARNLKQLAKDAKLKADISPHIVRHAFASHLLQNGADLRVIQTLLGHSDISTTQIYTHVQMDKMRETLEKQHPLSMKTL